VVQATTQEEAAEAEEEKKEKVRTLWVGADSVTTYRGGAEGVGAGSMTPWTAWQCQWVQEARDVVVAKAVEVAQAQAQEAVGKVFGVARS
jgi:hypothetical protein